MRFSLQDVKKSVHRRGDELSVSLHFLRPGELRSEIEQLLAYHEQLLDQPRRQFSLDVARECIGDYRLAQCLVATLSNWYNWQQREWTAVISKLSGAPRLDDISSPMQLRLALYSYVNQHYSGFLDAQTREQALQTFAAQYALSVPDLEYLLALDSEEEAHLVRTTPEPPSAQEVATLYNQWAFEAALFNASSVHFTIDCDAFGAASSIVKAEEDAAWTSSRVSTGVGTVIKRLCYLARKLGVYYDLAYTSSHLAPLLHLELYGPQEVTGAPQQYGLRLTRLCRLLLGYGLPGESGRDRRGNKSGKTTLSPAITEAEAQIHFLQRSYKFVMDAEVFRLLEPVRARQQNASVEDALQSAELFDSSIEQFFAEAFTALAKSQGVDGWHLEREPEPLLLDAGIFIPDFALTRDSHRIYVEILGFWTPAYRERKLQKLQQLQGRDDLLLAIPREARDAYAAVLPAFPVVFYEGRLSATEVVNMLRERYDDFVERLAQLNIETVRTRVRREGVLTEPICYALLHCYRRSEIQRAAERVVDSDIAFIPGLGLYAIPWLEQLHQSFIEWLSAAAPLPLTGVLNQLKEHWPLLADCQDTTLETLLSLWPEVQIRRDSIFEAEVSIVLPSNALSTSTASISPDDKEGALSEKNDKKQAREKRAASKKGGMQKRNVVQGDLW